MAIAPFINFANIAPQGDPGASNFMNNLMRGYQFGSQMQMQKKQREAQAMRNQMLAQQQAYLPFQQGMQEEKQTLANQLMQTQIDRGRQEMELAPQKLALSQAQTQSQRFGKLPSEVILRAMSQNPSVLENYGFSPEQAETLSDSLKTKYKKSDMSAADQQREAAAKGLNVLLSPEKREFLRNVANQGLKGKIFEKLPAGLAPAISGPRGVARDVLVRQIAPALMSVEKVYGTRTNMKEYIDKVVGGFLSSPSTKIANQYLDALFDVTDSYMEAFNAGLSDAQVAKKTDQAVKRHSSFLPSSHSETKSSASRFLTELPEGAIVLKIGDL